MDEATRLMHRFYLGSAPSKNPGFTYIVLCAKEYQPSRHLYKPAKILRIPLSDSTKPISSRLRNKLDDCAQTIAHKWGRGHRILVSCIMGRNRSALVSSLALAQITGHHPAEAARHIRNTRTDISGVPALQNHTFWSYLQNYPPRQYESTS